MLSSCSAVSLAIRWASTTTPLSLPADSLSYESLHAAVSALSLRPALPSAFQLGYLDDEGDFVRISTDDELRLLLTESERRLTGQQPVVVDVMRDASDSDDGDDHDSDSFVKVEAVDFSPQPRSPSCATATAAAAQHDAPEWPSPLSIPQPPSPPISSPPPTQSPAVTETAETAQAGAQQEKKETAADCQEEARTTAAQTATLSSPPGVTGSSSRTSSPARSPSRAPLPVAAPVAGGDNWSAATTLLCRLLQGLSYCVALAVLSVHKNRQRLTVRRVVKKSVRIVVVAALLLCCAQSFFSTRRQLSALQQHVRSQYRIIAEHTQELSELSLLSYKDWIGMLDSERAVLADTREELNALRLQLQTQQEIIRGMQAQLDAARADHGGLKDTAPTQRWQEAEKSRGVLWSKTGSEAKLRDSSGVLPDWDVELWNAQLERAGLQQADLQEDELSRGILGDIEALYGPRPPTVGASSGDDNEPQSSWPFSKKSLQPPIAASASSSSSSASASAASSRSQSRASAGSGSIQAAPWLSGRAGKKGRSSSSSSSCSASPSSSSCGRHHHDGDDEQSELFSALDSLPRLHHAHGKHMSRMSKKIGKAVQHVSDTAKRVWKTLF